MTTRLPSVTPEQCAQITGATRPHAAHTIYTTRILYHGIQNVPVGLCRGLRVDGTPRPPVDPFAGLDDEDSWEGQQPAVGP